MNDMLCPTNPVGLTSPISPLNPNNVYMDRSSNTQSPVTPMPTWAKCTLGTMLVIPVLLVLFLIIREVSIPIPRLFRKR